jgi:Kef-type K+ transport system membrane component KefB
MAALLKEPLARFIVQAVAIIGLSRIVGLAARRMRQPMVIAEIVAGVALGPSLLGWLSPSTKEALFPESSLAMLGVLSQVGLVLFMFLVGLELDPRLLKGRAHTSVAISHTSILVPFALGSLLSFYLYPRLSPASVPFSSFTLFMGVAMSITAFPVLARILVERRLLRTRVGAVTIACAAVDDVTAWCVLAFVVAIARSSGVAGAVRTTALALLYIGVMFAIVRPILRKVAARTGVKDGLSQHVVAAILIGTLLSAWVTDLVGIHALFGAFAFGAIIPKEGGLARALAERLEDLVVIFFLPLFFAYSGLRTQIGLLDTWASWGMCGLIVLAACAGKLGGSLAAARLTGLSWRESGALGILMNTRGLMELVVLNIGLDIGVISPALFTMMVLMALITTFMTSPALEWVYPLRELEKDVIEAAPAAAPPPPRGYTVLACVSFERSGPGMATLGAALLGEDAGSRFYALRLVPPAERASFVLEQQDAPDDAAPLRPLVARAEALHLSVRPLSFVSSQPAQDICNVASVKSASLVLLGWHKPLLGDAVLGGTVHEVLRRAACDVGVLVDRGLGRIEKILVPYLGSAHDRAALAAARRIVDHTGATAVVLHVTTPARGEKLGVGEKVEEVFQERTRGLSAQVVFKVVEHATPALAVVEESENDYDLIVIGVGAEWGLTSRPFGMQAELILSRATTSILVMRQGQSAAERAAERAAVDAAQAEAALAGRS